MGEVQELEKLVSVQPVGRPPNYGNEISKSAERGSRFNENKPRWSLLPRLALVPVVKVLMYGAKKYEPYNWAKGLSYSETCDSLLRHVNDWRGGETNDAESGCHHLAHAACNILFLLHFELNPDRYGNLDDRQTLI